MNYGTISHLPTNWIVIWCIIALIVIWMTYHGRRQLMPKAYLLGSLALRFAILLTLTLLLINPYTKVSTPDPAGFRVAVLADSSGSMETKDMPDGRSRLDNLSDYLASKEFSSLNKKYPNLELYSFCNQPIRNENNQLYTLPGRSAIGSTLQQTASSQSDLPLGAILLLSDGNSNENISLTDAAKGCRKAGIPVSAVGFGSRNKMEDLSVKAPKKRLKVERGKEITIPVEISSTFSKNRTIKLEFYDGSDLIESREVNSPANKIITENFSIKPQLPGVKAYRFKINADEKDSRPETDVDYASIEVEPPPFFKVLYLADSPNLQARFLKITLQSHSGLQFNSLIRATEKKLLTIGDFDSSEKIKETFPKEQMFYNQFDTIIAEPTVVVKNSHLPEILTSFVTNRGGGLLFCGNSSILPESLQKVVPFKNSELAVEKTIKYLNITGDFIFEETETEQLRSAPGPSIPAYTSYLCSTGIKPGARPGLSMKRGDKHLLAAQQYGSGRVVCFGATHDWKWHFKAGASERHLSFWSSLLSWLGSSAKPRITLDFNGSKVPLNEEVKLAAKVLDQEFQPSLAANVSALIKYPDGTATELQMGFSANDAGLFSENFIPSQPGEYQVTLYASFPDGHIIEQKGAFIAIPMSGEMADTTFMEDVLRDTCRITGGEYFSEPHKIEQLKTADKLPLKHEQIIWFSLLYLPLLLLVLITLEIYIRRRIGLK